jgi:polyisoprenoid-binding protein YceI
MNKKVILGGLAGLLIIVVLGFAYVLRPTEEASESIEAIPLNEGVQEPTQVDLPTEVLEEEPTEVVGEANKDSSPEGFVVFQIDQGNSEVRFSLDELLRGNPFTPVGTTNQVAGEIGIDFSDPSASQLGTVLINARTLETDSSNRDRAIKNQILDTGDFEFISFTPTNLTGFLPEIVLGEEVQLKITGDLTIRDITNSVIFDVNVTVISGTEIQGYGSAEVLRSDYNLNIPSVPSVAEVTNEVLLEIDFFAVAN